MYKKKILCNRSSISPFVVIFQQMSILQTRINFMEKARLKEEIFTGDDLQHFVLIKKNGKINLFHFIIQKH